MLAQAIFNHALQTGLTSSTNIIMDNNEIMARNNGSVSALNLNPDGGDINFHSNTGSTTTIGTSTTTLGGKVIIPQTATTIGGSNLGNASLLLGSTTAGIGIDTNEIVSKGDHLYIGTATDGRNIIFRTDATSAVLTLDSSQNATFSGDIKAASDSAYDIGANATRFANVYADNIVGGNSTLVASDANNYFRINATNASAQLGLFRTSSSGGGGYIGADSSYIFSAWTSGFARRFEIDNSGNVTFDGTITPGQGYYGNGQNLDYVFGRSIYLTTTTTGFLIKTDIVSNNYAMITGTIKLEQFNVSSKQTIEFSATVLNTGSVQSKKGTADKEVTIKLFVYNNVWHVWVPAPSTYTTASAYIETHNSYQGQSRQFNEVNTISVSAVPSSGVSGSVDIACKFSQGDVTFAGEILVPSGDFISWGTSGYSAIEGSTVSNNLKLRTNNTVALTLDSSQNATFAGNVGIKESSIDANLHITDTNPNIKFERSGQGKWAFGIPNSQTYLAFDETSDDLSTPTMVLTKTTKRVGIGTSNPGYKLEVGEDTNGTANLLMLRNSDSTYAQTWGFQSDTNKDLVITGSSGSGGFKEFVPGSRGSTFTGDVYVEGDFSIKGATLHSYHQFQSDPVSSSDGNNLFSIGGHGMAAGYSRNISIWSTTVGTWRSWVGTNLRWDGTNYKRASNAANNNWGNVAGIEFKGGSNGSDKTITFYVDEPENASGGTTDSTVGTSIPTTWKALEIDNNRRLYGYGNMYLGSFSYFAAAFYSQSNTAYYVDPDGTSQVNKFRLNTTSDLQTGSSKLDVAGISAMRNSSDTAATLYIQNHSSTTSTIQPYIYLADSGGNRGGLGVETSTAIMSVNGQGGLKFQTGASGVGGTEAILIDSSQNIKFNSAYIFPKTMGSAGQVLKVPSSGTTLEWGSVSGGGDIDGSGTANDIVMWSDSDTLTDAPIAISGTTSTFGGNVTIDPPTGNSQFTLRFDTIADSTIIGDVNWNSTGAEGTDDRLGIIRTRTQGGTTSTRGGEMVLYTRIANSSGFNTTTYAQNGQWSFPHHINMVDGKYLMWGGNAILQHNGTQTYVGDNTSSSTLTLTGGNATFAGSDYRRSLLYTQTNVYGQKI